MSAHACLLLPKIVAEFVLCETNFKSVCFRALALRLSIPERVVEHRVVSIALRGESLLLECRLSQKELFIFYLLALSYQLHKRILFHFWLGHQLLKGTFVIERHHEQVGRQSFQV